MENNVCPECGSPIGEGNTVCPECGFNLNQSGSSAETTENAFETQRKYFQNKIAEKSCIVAWGENNPAELRTSNTLNRLSAVFYCIAIAIGIGYVVHMIVSGITLNSESVMYERFRTRGIYFTVSTALSYIAGLIFDIVGDAYDLRKCTAWMNKYSLDGSKCLSLIDYGNAKKREGSQASLNLQVAYYSANPERLGGRLGSFIAEGIVKGISYFIFAIFISPVINQFIITQMEGDNWQPYIAFGFAAVCVVSFCIPAIMNVVLKNKYIKPAEYWLRKTR